MNEPPQTTISERIGACLVAAQVLIILLPAVSQVHSFDIFWQLQSGRHMLESGQFIRTDLFTLAPDVSRFEHTWLHDIIVYGLYSLAGYAGLSWWKGLMLAMTALMLAGAGRLRGARWLSVSLVLPLFFMTRGGWLERPQLWTFLLFAVCLAILEGYRRAPGPKLWLLLPVMVFWANVHAGSVLAVAILAAYLVGEGGNRCLGRSGLSQGDYLRLWWSVGMLLVAAVLTPYPSKLWQTLGQVAHYGSSTDSAGQPSGPVTALFNMDWTPTSFAAEPSFFYLMGATAVVLMLGWRRWSLVDLCLLGGLALMGMQLRRHIPFFYMGMVAILPVYLDDIGERLAGWLPRRWRFGLHACAVLLCAVLTADLAMPAYRTHGVLKTGLREWHYPIAAAEFVREQTLPTNLYNTYDWGGYLAWQLFPAYRVFWDGRQNSPQMFQLGWNVMAGQPDWAEILDRFGVNTIVSKACTMDTAQRYPLLDRLRASPDWSLVLQDGSSTVFVRDSAVDPLWLGEHRLDKRRIDEAILFEARRLVTDNPGRYYGWWELAKIYMERRQHRDALLALEQYLSRTPVRDPLAERYYQVLVPIVRPVGAQP